VLFARSDGNDQARVSLDDRRDVSRPHTFQPARFRSGRRGGGL